MLKLSLKSKLKNVSRVINLMIIFELCFAPLAWAQEQDYRKSENNWRLGMEVLNHFTTFVRSGVQGMINASGTNSNVNGFKQQYAPHLALSPVDPSQVPGVFRGCTVLPASPNKLSEGLKCKNADQGQIQNGYAAAIIELAEENVNSLRNFLTEGHETKTTDGLTCYNESIKNANAQLLAREEQIKQYQDNLRKLLDDFNLKANPIVDAIKADSAFLDGGADFDKYHKDGMFSDLLLGNSDPNKTCGSIIDGTSLQRLGSRGGIRGIQDDFYNKINDTAGGKKYSAEKLLSSRDQMRKEINDLANNITADMSNRNSINHDINGVTYRGRLFPKNNKALSRVLSNFSKEQNSIKSKLATQYNIEELTAGSDSQNMLSRYLGEVQKDNNPINYNDLVRRLDQYERNQKMSCLKSDYLAGKLGGVSSFANKFKNPNINLKGQDNAYAETIQTAISNAQNFDEIINILEKKESEESFKNYVYIPKKSIVLQDRTIPASVPMRASSYISIFRDQCEDKFTAQNPANPAGYSQEQAVNELKKYAMEMTNMRKVASSKLNSLIKEELLTCSADTTTGSASNSCDGAFNKDGDNFCLRTATKCASNMKSCYSKINGIFVQAKTRQQNNKNQYNVQVQNLVKDLKAEMNAVNNLLIAQANSIEAQLDMGGVFKTPTLKFQKAQRRYLAGVDQSLMMEDPQAYLDALLKDSEEMKKAMAAQRIEYFGSDGKGGSVNKQKQQYLSNYRESMKYWQSEVITDCQQAIVQVSQGINQQNEQRAEQNQKTEKACASLQAFNQNPDSVEVESLATELGEVVQIAAANPMVGPYSSSDKAAIAQIRAFDSKCEASSENTNPYMDTDKNSNLVSSQTFCDNEDAKSLYGADAERACNRFKDLKGGFCDDTALRTKLAGKRFCKALNGGNPIIITSTDESECAKNTGDGLEKEYTLNADFTAISKSEGILSAVGCNSSKDQYEAALTDLKHLAAAYNCKKKREQAGAIYVSVCGGISGSGVGKDIWHETAQQAGAALGQSYGLRN